MSTNGAVTNATPLPQPEVWKRGKTSTTETSSLPSAVGSAAGPPPAAAASTTLTPAAAALPVSRRGSSRYSPTPLPSKQRLSSTRSSSAVISGSYTPSVTGTPTADGDVYVVNVSNASFALCVCYTNDNKLLAVGETNGMIRLLRTASHDLAGLLALPLEGPTAAVTCLRRVPSPAGNALLASYSDGSVRLWDVKSATVTGQLTEDRQTLGLAVSPDQTAYATVGDDGAVLVYDAHTLQLISKLLHSHFPDRVDGHMTRVFSAVYHPQNCNEFLTGGWDDSVLFWDQRTGTSMRYASPAHICGTEAIDISRDGTQVLTSSWRQAQQLQLWDYGTAKLIEAIEPDKIQSCLYAGKYLTDNLVCCGGSDQDLLRLVHFGQKATTGTVTNLPSGVYSIDTGPVGARYQPNPGLNNGRHLLPLNSDKTPRVAFCCNQRVVELEIY